MNPNIKLTLFQVIIFLLGVLFLVLYYQKSDIGRYQMTTQGNLMKVIDTSTGKYYTVIGLKNPMGSDFDSMYVRAKNFWKKKVTLMSKIKKIVTYLSLLKYIIPPTSYFI